jgi:hypothetical protein
MVTGNVGADICGLGFVQNPTLMLWVVGVLFSEVAPDHAPRPVLISVAEFAG